ncbi:hypothetical protein ABW21_db0206666 [Orbilia brochopaga]|nr:hypothetical protein ABW21_db0206666 [Drechslerella brochopaga]
MLPNAAIRPLLLVPQAEEAGRDPHCHVGADLDHRVLLVHRHLALPALRFQDLQIHRYLVLLGHHHLARVVNPHFQAHRDLQRQAPLVRHPAARIVYGSVLQQLLHHLRRPVEDRPRNLRYSVGVGLDLLVLLVLLGRRFQDLQLLVHRYLVHLRDHQGHHRLDPAVGFHLQARRNPLDHLDLRQVDRIVCGRGYPRKYSSERPAARVVQQTRLR